MVCCCSPYCLKSVYVVNYNSDRTKFVLDNVTFSFNLLPKKCVSFLDSFFYFYIGRELNSLEIPASLISVSDDDDYNVYSNSFSRAVSLLNDKYSTFLFFPDALFFWVDSYLKIGDSSLIPDSRYEFKFDYDTKKLFYHLQSDKNVLVEIDYVNKEFLNAKL